MTEREIIERIKTLRSQNIVAIKKSEAQIEEENNRKKRWVVYWRNNPNLYIHFKMGITNFGYEHLSLYEMSQSTTYFEVSTRNTAKTFRAIEYGISQCLLRPFCKVGITAVIRDQANDDYRKFMDEFVNKKQMSPLVSYLYDNGLITSKEIDKGYLINFWNGSTMIFFPCIESSRGLRLNVLIVEECRLIKKGLVDSVALHMLTPRQPEFKNLSEYKENRNYDEAEQTIYITSNRFRGEWFNTLFNKTFVGYFKNKLGSERVLCFDIFLALKHGLKTPQWYFTQKEGMNDLDFRMEVLNETVGEVDGAYFTIEQFRKNQVIKEAFRPPTVDEFKNGTIKNRKKKDNEYRFVFVDFAWAGDNGETQNDQTVIGCASCYLYDEKLHRNIEYIETYSGSDASMIPLRVKEIFWDYEADYVVYDNRSGGELLFNQLSSVQDNPHRTSSEWNNHGFTICEEKDLQMVSDDKLRDLRSRTIDPQAIPCLIPIIASRESNSSMWQDMQLRLKNEDISFLVDELEFETLYTDKKEYMFLSSEEKARVKLPYVQTMLMITEAVSLTQVWNNGLLKLEEHGRGGYKDKIVATCYFNMIASKLETKLLKEDNQEDIDITQYQWIV
jgi:hypothetical protein